VKDNDQIYHLTESLFKIIDFSVTSIHLKTCDKIWLALDRAHHILYINELLIVVNLFKIQYFK